MSPSQIARPPRQLQIVGLGVVALGLVVGAFQIGRQSVQATTLEIGPTNSGPKSDRVALARPSLRPEEFSKIAIRNIATVSFSELYDVLRSASREQLLAWAKDLEALPRGPRQIAAVTAYYKSLIQVNPAAAIEAVLRAENLPVRDVAIDALLATAPDSIWGDICKMMTEMRYPERNFPIYSPDPFARWSGVDPVAASQYLESKPTSQLQAGLDSLLRLWGAMDPKAATKWMEADSARQTEEGIQALLYGRREIDPAGAVEYALKNSSRANFAKGISSLAYAFVRYQQPDSARALITGLAPEQATLVLHHIASETTAVYVDGEADYQRPPGEVARWRATLPRGLWENEVGVVFQDWFRLDETAALSWLSQLPVTARDAAIAGVSDTYWPAEQFLPLALTISNSQLRDKTLRVSLRPLSWRTQDEANQTIANLLISPLEKQYLLRIIAEETPNEN